MEAKAKKGKVVITIDRQEEGIGLGLSIKRVSKMEAGAMIAWAKDQLMQDMKKNPKEAAAELANVLMSALDKMIEKAEAEDLVKKAAKAAKKAAKKEE